MKPMHHEVTRLSRCPCCVSKYSRNSAKNANNGKSAARQAAKRQIFKELKS